MHSKDDRKINLKKTQLGMWAGSNTKKLQQRFE